MCCDHNSTPVCLNLEFLVKYFDEAVYWKEFENPEQFEVWPDLLIIFPNFFWGALPFLLLTGLPLCGMFEYPCVDRIWTGHGRKGKKMTHLFGKWIQRILGFAPFFHSEIGGTFTTWCTARRGLFSIFNDTEKLFRLFYQLQLLGNSFIKIWSNQFVRVVILESLTILCSLCLSSKSLRYSLYDNMRLSWMLLLAGWQSFPLGYKTYLLHS